jgi:hypothetical protein
MSASSGCVGALAVPPTLLERLEVLLEVRIACKNSVANVFLHVERCL